MLKRTVTAIFCISLIAGPTFGADADKPVAHPAMWTVHGKHSTVYLLGSVHILPPNLVWRDERIEKAIYSADTYVFEVPTDADAAKRVFADKGSLPPGQSLRAMLPPEAQTDLDADFAMVHVPEASFDTRRPWLVSLALSAIQMTQNGNSPYSGVDFSIMAEVGARGKPVRYLETLEQQFALLAPDDPKVELDSFEAFLKDFRTEKDELPAMIHAWSVGDLKTLNDLTLGHLAEHPDARKALIDDRNRAWIKQIEPMLDNEKGTFLITVGALHLVGDVGVPALLRADGYKVEGP
jgi:uncharacterized protein YbaP (TraB family)